MPQKMGWWAWLLFVLPGLTLAQDVTVTPSPAPLSYGVQWFNAANGDMPFVNLVSAAYAPADLLYVVDTDLGVIQLDSTTGVVLAVFPNARLSAPSDIATDSAGNVYVADVGCRCILTLGIDGIWQPETGDFNDGAPLSIAVAPGSRLYATDYDDTGVLVRVFQNGEDQTTQLGVEVSRQPLLTVDATGRVLAVTGQGAVMALENGGFVPLFVLSGIASGINDFAADANGNLLLATGTEGIIVVNSSGEVVERLGRIVANFPLAGEVVNPKGVAVSPDGMIYWVDSDGQFGAVTAMSQSADAVRTGETSLRLDVPVQGTLSAAIPQQRWTFNAIGGQQVTINAVEVVHDAGLDVALRLLAPDGSEEAYNDDQLGADLYSIYDAQIPLHTLESSGAYTVVVEWVRGEGTYGLGINTDRSFELSSDSVTRLEGRLQDALPTQRWTFAGSAGQVFTITMQAEAGSTLDPLLRLLAPNGELVAWNDDAADPALGVNAQLSQVALPADGTYVIEASRYEGEGAYTLVIVATT